MTQTTHVLISLDGRFADAILAGTKRVELRRRPMNLEPGAVMWIYGKVPVGRLMGSVCVSGVKTASPTSLWNQFGPVSGLSRREFYSYFEGAERGYAIQLSHPRKLKAGVSLEKLRTLVSGFQPPQFFARLSAQHPIVSAASLA